MIANILRALLFGVAVGAVAVGVAGIGMLVGWAAWEMLWPVWVTTATVGVLASYVKSAVVNAVQNRVQTVLKKMDRLNRGVGDIHGMLRLSPYMDKLPLPFGGGWALAGDSAALLAREVILRQPKLVVELGSGVSTLVIGQILARHAGSRLISFDHDAHWAAETRRYVEYLGLGSVVTVVDAPLSPILVGGRQLEWYAIDPDLLSSINPIDLLVVDGPPARNSEGGMARFPAFPVFRERLSAQAIVFVDDSRRKGESEMIREWERSAPEWNTSFFDTVDGVAIMSRSLGRT